MKYENIVKVAGIRGDIRDLENQRTHVACKGNHINVLLNGTRLFGDDDLMEQVRVAILNSIDGRIASLKTELSQLGVTF